MTSEIRSHRDLFVCQNAMDLTVEFARLCEPGRRTSSWHSPAERLAAPVPGPPMSGRGAPLLVVVEAATALSAKVTQRDEAAK